MPVYTPLILTNFSNTHEHKRASVIKHSLCQLYSTHLYSTTWIYWSVYTRLAQHTPNARSCRCNQLYLDYNSLHQNLRVLVWHWLLLSSESCSLLIQLFWAMIQSVFTHDEKHVQLRNTEYVERWDCYLFIAYIFFTWLNMRVIILVNKLYCSFISRPPGWETLT